MLAGDVEVALVTPAWGTKLAWHELAALALGGRQHAMLQTRSEQEKD